VLMLYSVKRSQMGNYLCIATNGHPPAVSRRVKLKIHCKKAHFILHLSEWVVSNRQSVIYLRTSTWLQWFIIYIPYN
jgi:hypothetical protein